MKTSSSMKTLIRSILLVVSALVLTSSAFAAKTISAGVWKRENGEMLVLRDGAGGKIFEKWLSDTRMTETGIWTVEAGELKLRTREEDGKISKAVEGLYCISNPVPNKIGLAYTKDSKPKVYERTSDSEPTTKDEEMKEFAE